MGIQAPTQLTGPPAASSLAQMRAGFTQLAFSAGFARLALAMSGLCWFYAASASAATVTVGSPLTAPYFSTLTCSGLSGCMYANTVLTEPGANVTSPVSGRVVRWRIAGNYQGPFVVRVLRPAGGGQYTGVGSTLPVEASGTATVSFPANLPIQKGDLVAIDYENGRHLATATASGSAFSVWVPPVAELASAPPGSTSGNLEVLFNADVQPQPEVTGLAPGTGAVGGGTAVVISGKDFDEVAAVSFGTTAAASFNVDSESQITAVSPPASGPGVVDVRVTTTAGTSPIDGADQFTYTASTASAGDTSTGAKCIVPKLKGKRVKAARRKLTRAGCELGKVRGHRAKKAVVKRQHPRPGRTLPLHGKVAIKVGAPALRGRLQLQRSLAFRP